MPDEAMIGPVAAPDLHVMTFNVRRRIRHLSKTSPDRWERRRAPMASLLRREQPTLLGTQEALADQADDILDALGDDYRCVGRGRGPAGDDESNAVFWNSARLRLIGWEQCALSGTPEVPGSKDWGNPWPRIVVSARFEDRATAREFLVINTHLDPISRRSRRRSAEVLRALAIGSEYPVIVTGDFNTGPRSAPHRALTDTVLHDLWTSVPERLSPDWGTFADYKKPRLRGNRIDWILGTHEVEVLRAGANSAHESGWPSDHLPVQAVVRMTGTG